MSQDTQARSPAARKVVLNGANLQFGGGVQVCVGLIEAIVEHGDASGLEWQFLVSPEVWDCLTDRAQQDGRCTVIEGWCSGLLMGSPAKSRINAIIDEFKPELVFTVFGPIYFNVKAVHLMGFADPWILNPNGIAWSRLGLRARIHLFLRLAYKRLGLVKADYWWVETDLARGNLAKILSVEPGRVFSIPNYPSMMLQEKRTPRSFEEKIRVLDTLEMVYIAHPHIHKNHRMLVDISKELKSRGVKHNITVTIPPDSDEWLEHSKLMEKEGVAGNFTNVGRVSLPRAFDLYGRSHVLLFPSLLEVFSTSFFEAMATETLIVTADFNFNRTVCHKYALYYAPTDAGAASNILADISRSPTSYDCLVKSAKAYFDSIDANDKYVKHVASIKAILAS